MPVIFHLDLDSFFVSAERLRNPRLRGRTVAIGGSGPRGVIASCSYEARKFGVRSAMPTAQALRLCPRLILVPGDHAYYSRLSREVFAIVGNYAPVFEQVSIDEAYLDMSGTESLHGPAVESAQRLRAEIRARTGLTASIGIAPNRLVAKIASDTCKPDNFRVVRPGEEPEFLAPLPVGVIPGCGKVTQKWLESRAIFRIADLQRTSREMLERELGSMGSFLHDAALGKGRTAFHEESKVRSISRETTFERDVGERERLLAIVWSMVEELGASLREDGEYARGIRLKLRYPPFRTVTRSRVLQSPSQADQALYGALEKLFDESWEQEPLRLLGVGCVLGDGKHQLDLFEDRRTDAGALDRLKDEVRRKFGDQALQTGRTLAKL